jgi:hypothetical protein
MNNELLRAANRVSVSVATADNETHKNRDMVITKLLADGYTDVMVYQTEPEECIKFIPEKNWERINSCYGKIKTEEKTLDAFLASAAKLGYLKFEPYIKKNSNGTPTLALKYNRYLHLFRGYYYQVSYTPDGIGEYSTPGIRINEILKLFEDMKNSKLLHSLYYMNCIAACFGIDEFDKLLKTKPELVDEFMRLSVEGVLADYKTTYKDLMGYKSSNRDDTLSITAKYVYNIPYSETMDVCRLYDLSQDYPRFVVEYLRNGNIQREEYNFADILAGVDVEELADYWGYSVEEITKITSEKIKYDPRVYCELVVFILNSVGVKCNFMVAYSVNPCDALMAINSPNTIRAKNLNAIYDNIRQLNAD